MTQSEAQTWCTKLKLNMKQQHLEWVAFGVQMLCLEQQKVFFGRKSVTVVALRKTQPTKICKHFSTQEITFI